MQIGQKTPFSGSRLRLQMKFQRSSQSYLEFREYSNVIEIQSMRERYPILEKECVIIASSSDFDMSIPVLECYLTANLQNVKHILIVPENREQREVVRETLRGKSVQGVEERDDVLMPGGRIQRLCIGEGSAERSSGRVRGRLENKNTGGSTAACWVIVNEHVVEAFQIMARPEIAWLKGTSLIWCQDASVVLERPILQNCEPTESPG